MKTRRNAKKTFDLGNDGENNRVFLFTEYRVHYLALSETRQITKSSGHCLHISARFM